MSIQMLTPTEQRLDEQFAPDAETQRRIDRAARAVAQLVAACPRVTAAQLQAAVVQRLPQT